MGFEFHQLVRSNKKLFIWAAFFGLLYLARELFALVFLTFILCYIFNNVIGFLDRGTRIPRRVCQVLVYLVFIVIVVAVLSAVMPRLAVEAKLFLEQLPESLDTLHGSLDDMGARQPGLAPLLSGFKETLTVQNLLGVNREALVDVILGLVNRLTHYVNYFLLGILFSFFILFDLPNLSRKTLSLRQTRFRDVYDETAESVAQFALVVGSAFQAQVLIAVVNTGLTAAGLWLLDVQPVALLSIIVFFAGLIPVLGTFISSVPILMLAFNAGGVLLVFKAAAMIAVVHAVEAYGLNPRIFSAVFRINPVLTLIILYIGYSLFGLWGVVLGVPVSVYIYRHLILSPPQDGGGAVQP